MGTVPKVLGTAPGRIVNSGAYGPSKRITTDYYEPKHGTKPLEDLSAYFCGLTEAERMCGLIQRLQSLRRVSNTCNFVQ